MKEHEAPKNGACDLCGARDAIWILASPRLEGPLMKCHACGLVYVAATVNGPGPPVAEEMDRLSRRARDLSLVEPSIEESETPWRELMARERLDDLRRFATSGRLLEVGCSTGEFLLAARQSFVVAGVEADQAAFQMALSRGIDCLHGALHDARFPSAQFDVAVLYHVFEHFRHPRRELSELARVVKPGGWLVIETPDVKNIWFRLLGARWRQIIPDHLYFFSPATLGRLLAEDGFVVHELRHVGKAMSTRLFISRIGRYSPAVARLLSAISRGCGWEDLTLRLNLGDVMRVYAKRN